MRRVETFSLVATIMLVAANIACAQDNVPSYAPGSDESPNYQSEIALKELNNPAGLVVREGPVATGPHELFIAESGAGRIIRISTAEPEKVSDAITGFPVGSYSIEPSYQIGPLGMALLTRTKLIVGEGGRETGENLVGVYSLPIGGSPITADEADHTVGPVATTDEQKQFLGMVKTETSLFLAAGGIQKAGIEANRLTAMQSFISSENFTQQGSLTYITITPKSRPSFLVVGKMGSKEVANDSSITFFVPSSGALALNLDTGLHDLSSLAYSPAGNLYALDIAWQDEPSGGVYRLDDARVEGKQACRAVKIASIVRPTALAFTPDGTLYVTAFGSAASDKQGVLVKITGKF